MPLENLRDNDTIIDISKRYIPTPKQYLAHTAQETNLLYGGAMGGGKMQGVNESVCTPFGIKRFGDIKVDDFVIGKDGLPTRVIKIWEHGEQDLYKITFTDGSFTHCGLEHLWLVSYSSTKHKKNNVRVREWGVQTTEQIISWMDKGLVDSAGVKKHPLIPLCDPVHFNRTYKTDQFNLDSYVVGLLLGDGCITKQLGITSEDMECISAVEKEALRLGCRTRLNQKKESSCFDLSITNNSKLIALLIKLGIYGHKADTKFIPEIYKTASIEQRIAIIQGLCDSDGYIDARGHPSFCSISKQLAEDVQYMIRSLGGKATITSRIPTFRSKGILKDGQRAYNVTIRTNNDGMLFRLQRKLDRIKKYNGGCALKNRIESIDFSHREECRCITVDAPDGLYLTNDFIVTHNSTWLCVETRELLLEYDGNVGFLGRWESTTFNRTTLVTLLKHLPKEIIKKHSTYEHYIQFVNNSILYYGGLKPTQASAPIDKFKSMELGFFGIDEASEVPESIFLVLASRLRIPIPRIHYRALLTSNPERGWVRDRFVKQNLPDHCFVQALPKDNPHNPPDYESKLRELFPSEWVEKYLNGDWDFAIEDNYVFTFNMISNAMERNLPRSGDVILGVDFARKGKDNTVISATWNNGHNEILYTCDYTPDLMPVVGKVGQFIDELHPKKVIGDAVGLGAGACDRLREVHGDIVIDFVGGAKAENPKRYDNRRAEAYWTFRKKLEDGISDLPNDEKIRQQASSIKGHIDSDRVVRIESKAEMKDSPDEMDAIIMSNSMTGNKDEIIGYVRKWRGRTE